MLSEKKRFGVFSSRDLIAFIVTSLLYLLGGMALFYTTHNVEVSDKLSLVKTIELSLNAYHKPEPAAEEKPKPPEEKKPLPECRPEPEEPQPIKPKPLEPSPVEPEPEPVKKEIKKPEVKKEILKEKPEKVVKKPETRPKQISSAHQSIRKQQSAASAKNLFLSRIRERINRHKSYPHIAKRRGMQGSVKVRFTIMPDGTVSDIHLSGSRIFHRSARNAVQSAFPVSVKNIPMRLPQGVTVILNYRLTP